MKKILMILMILISGFAFMNCGSGQKKEDAPAAAEEAPAEEEAAEEAK